MAISNFPFSGPPRRPRPTRNQPVKSEKPPDPSLQPVPENPKVPDGQPELPEEPSETKGPRPGLSGRPRRVRLGFPRPPGR